MCEGVCTFIVYRGGGGGVYIRTFRKLHWNARGRHRDHLCVRHVQLHIGLHSIE